MEAKVRCLTRQLGCLRDELRREAKRTAWALKKSKDHEQIATALETKTNELLFLNNKLTTELANVEESRKAYEELKTTEIRELKEALLCKEREGQKFDAYCGGQLAVVASQIMQIETTISNNRTVLSMHDALATDVFSEIETLCGRAVKSTLHLNALLTRDPSTTKSDLDDNTCISPANLINDLQRDVNVKLMPNSQQTALVSYRKCVVELRAQIACSDRRLQESMKKNTDFAEELKRTNQNSEHLQKEHDAIVHQLQQTNNELNGNLQHYRQALTTKGLEHCVHQREVKEEKQRKLHSIEQEKVGFLKEIQDLKQTVVRQSESIRKKEAMLLKHKNDISSALEVFHGDGSTIKTHTEVTKARPLPFESLISCGANIKQTDHEDVCGFSEVDEEIAALDEKFNAVKRTIM